MTSGGIRTPPPPSTVGSYEVRVRSGVGGVLLVGHDRLGNPMMEVRVLRRHISAKMVRNVAQWCRENDDEPEIRIAT